MIIPFLKKFPGPQKCGLGVIFYANIFIYGSCRDGNGYRVYKDMYNTFKKDKKMIY